VSLTEKIIDEINKNPELGQRLRKILEVEALNQILAEEKSIREYITLMTNEQKNLRQDFNSMMAEQAKLRQEVVALRQDFNSMMAEQAKLRQEVVALRQDFNEMLRQLNQLRSHQVKADEKLDSMLSGMLNGFGEMSKFAGVSFEEFTRHFMEKYLKGMKILPENKKLVAKTIDSEEIDIFCDSPVIVGEVTASASSAEEADKLLRKAELVQNKLGKVPIKYLIILTTTKETYAKLQQVCRENAIELIVGKVTKNK